MSQSKHSLQALQGTTLRRLRNTPGYFFLIWRWSMWLYALIVVLGTDYTPLRHQIGIILLIVTFLQTLIVTLYPPFLHILLPRISTLLHFPHTSRRPRPPTEDETADILTPLSQTRNLYLDMLIYGVDLLICGLVMYYGGASRGM